MLACNLKNLNDVRSFTSLDTTTLNYDHEMTLFHFTLNGEIVRKDKP